MGRIPRGEVLPTVLAAPCLARLASPHPPKLTAPSRPSREGTTAAVVLLKLAAYWEESIRGSLRLQRGKKRVEGSEARAMAPHSPTIYPATYKKWLTSTKVVSQTEGLLGA